MINPISVTVPPAGMVLLYAAGVILSTALFAEKLPFQPLSNTTSPLKVSSNVQFAASLPVGFVMVTPYC